MHNGPASFADHIKSWPLALLPHRLLSHMVRRLTRCRLPWIKNLLIGAFSGRFDINLQEATEADPYAYPDFNSFFTRALRADARSQPADPLAIACPVDGTVSAAGRVETGRLLQAKGIDYPVAALLGDDRRAGIFTGGSFATIYLSPRDYHRIHMPCDGRLTATSYIPGRLFSVAPHTTRAIPGLFTRNERLVALFDSDYGPFAVIMVGAIFVSCMETAWSGIVNPTLLSQPQHTDFAGDAVTLARGDEMGRFNMGSTVILLFAADMARLSTGLLPGNRLRLGEPLGSLEK